MKNFNYKLANYERATGHRVAVRVEPDFMPSTPGQARGGFVKALAGELHLSDTGDNVLALRPPRNLPPTNSRRASMR